MNNEINEIAEMQEMTMKFYNKGIEVSNKYWQDKIKDKIKECEENEKLFAFIQNESYARQMNKDFIILLKELLEE